VDRFFHIKGIIEEDRCMVLPEKGHMLRIYIGESDKKDGAPLYEWLVKKAREHGLAGATVIKGVLGFGAHSRIHTSKILRLSEDMPMVIEIVDTLEKIDKFMPVVDQTINEGLAIVEEVSIRFYRT
jgi:PII-like signaling protein